MSPPVLPLIAMVLLIGAVIVYQYKARKARRQAMRRLGRSWGFTYTESDRSYARRYEQGFATLRHGSNRYVTNLLRGEHASQRLAIFDHHHTTSTGKSTHHHVRTFVLFRLNVDLGRIEMRPEHLGDKFASVFGFDDIDFESARFSDRYHIQAQDKKLAYQIFHPTMIEYFLGREKIRLATDGADLLAWRRDRTLRRREIRGLVEDVLGFVERIPHFLRKDRSAK